MIVTTTEEIPGYEVRAVHGFVTGSMVRAKDMFKDIGASIKGLVGGELRSYSTLLTEARNEAMAQMVKAADQAGANAVVAVRMTSSQIARSAAEVYVYGTAVTVERCPQPDTADAEQDSPAQDPGTSTDDAGDTDS